LADRDVSTKGSVTQPSRKKAVLFELENVVFAGHQLVYQAARTVLSKYGVDLTVPQFSRHCLGRAAETYIGVLLTDGKKQAPDKESVAHEIRKAVAAAFSDENRKPAEAALRLLKKLREKGLQLGALTGFDRVFADGLIAKLGPGEWGITLHSYGENGSRFPNRDDWRNLAGAMRVNPGCACALVTTGPSCHAALAAGIACIAVPDQLTAFQDFGGSCYIVDTPEALPAEQILKILEISQ